MLMTDVILLSLPLKCKYNNLNLIRFYWVFQVEAQHNQTTDQSITSSSKYTATN